MGRKTLQIVLHRTMRDKRALLAWRWLEGHTPERHQLAREVHAEAIVNRVFA